MFTVGHKMQVNVLVLVMVPFIRDIVLECLSMCLCLRRNWRENQKIAKKR